MSFFDTNGMRFVQPLVAQSLSGTTPTKLGSGEKRAGLLVRNHDPAAIVWVGMVPRGTSAPTLSGTAHIHAIAPNSTLALYLSESVDVYAQSATGAAVAISSQEFRS